MLIVFEQELLGDADRSDIVEHHRVLRQVLERHAPDEVSTEIDRHIMRLRADAKLNSPARRASQSGA